MENFLGEEDQEQNSFSKLERLIVESSDAKYDDTSTPVPIVANIEVDNVISNNDIPIHPDYEDGLLQ
jgi:hypothetical protein